MYCWQQTNSFRYLFNVGILCTKVAIIVPILGIFSKTSKMQPYNDFNGIDTRK